MTTSRPFISLEHVTLRLGDTYIFEDMEWEIFSDQHWAIIGPNGSGKSILADALCRKVIIAQGRISFFFDSDGNRSRSYLNQGDVVSISPDTLRELLMQHAGYHQARWQSFEGQDAPTVSELLSGKSIEHRSPYEVTPLKTDDAVYQQRREVAIELLDIEYLLPRKIVHVSHGESRKVLIARALMQAPKLLILDDPFCGLDNTSREVLKDTIELVLAAGQFQIVLVTSREEEILQGITNLLCVDEKRIVEKGPKDQVLQTDFVRSLFADKNMHTQASKTSVSEFIFPSPPPSKKTIGNSLVKMSKTSVSYGDVTVLENIDWTMRSGQHWAVLGHNGAGKTTLLSMILADNPQAYANDILLFDKKRGSGESIWAIKQHIGWVSPELQIYYQRGMTCYQAVCSGFFDTIGLYKSCSEEQYACATAWMHSLEIDSLASRTFSGVSAGEQRLVLLARALVKHPALLVLDEPCQGLDTEHRRHIIGLLDQLCQKTAVSMIYVTHHFDEMPDAISHVLQLECGRIRHIGTRKDILG